MSGSGPPARISACVGAVVPMGAWPSRGRVKEYDPRRVPFAGPVAAAGVDGEAATATGLIVVALVAGALVATVLVGWTADVDAAPEQPAPASAATSAATEAIQVAP